MSWFNRKKSVTTLKTALDNRQAIVEIETTKDAAKEAIAEAKDASQKLNTLLVENGFTLKIYLAAHPSAPKGKNK